MGRETLELKLLAQTGEFGGRSVTTDFTGRRILTEEPWGVRVFEGHDVSAPCERHELERLASIRGIAANAQGSTIFLGHKENELLYVTLETRIAAPLPISKGTRLFVTSFGARRLLFTTGDATATIYQLFFEGEKLITLASVWEGRFNKEPTQVALSHDGRAMAMLTGEEEEVVQYVPLNQVAQPSAILPVPIRSPASAIALNDTGKELYVASEDKRLRVFKLDNPKAPQLVTVSSLPFVPTGLCVSGNNAKLVASAQYDDGLIGVAAGSSPSYDGAQTQGIAIYTIRRTVVPQQKVALDFSQLGSLFD